MSVPRYKVTNELAAADFDAIEALLRTSYWAAERPRDVIEQTFRSPASIPFFVLDMTGVATGSPPATVGFGRVVTDRLTIGWLCDVMIDPSHRGAGIGKLLVSSMLHHPDLNKPGVRLVLGTKDAHGLYEQFGFFRRELMWRHPMGATATKGF
ncbi:GNAT family N-acetyltransferase [Humisphaera borealis]|uniref:GNAT family N-acetyltransferase n=1 Tax=Humisphaera borealis TaxID=2807512 RepID=A0A7M2WQ84_9BACT|nr:GNAT family N-acetyltransferase [Humisphaera borealis]QOV87648.1 GNAT family N-acetyltransferase [Humisphaera borealis]